MWIPKMVYDLIMCKPMISRYLNVLSIQNLMSQWGYLKLSGLTWSQIFDSIHNPLKSLLTITHQHLIYTPKASKSLNYSGLDKLLNTHSDFMADRKMFVFVPAAEATPIKLYSNSKSLTTRIQSLFFPQMSPMIFGSGKFKGINHFMLNGFGQFELPSFWSLIQDCAKMKELDKLLN